MSEVAHIIAPKIERHATGLTIPQGTSFEDWSDFGNWLQSAERSLMWWIGDWWAFGEHEYGDRAKAAIASDYTLQACMDAGWVSRQYETSDRSEVLSWTHHRTAASLQRAVRQELLARAAREGWSVREVRAAVNRQKNSASLPRPGKVAGRLVRDIYALVRAGEKFGSFYADPPWRYDNQGTRASTDNHYETMTVAEICALPVKELAAPDAHLHLWTTNAFLFDCPRVFEAWGFEYRSSFIWCKPQLGIGNYWRNSHEFLLTAIRGDAKRFNDHNLKSWLECDRGKHSAKPEQVPEFIERASPGPYFEMFGRDGRDNWTVWGDQFSQSLFDHGREEVA